MKSVITASIIAFYAGSALAGEGTLKVKLDGIEPGKAIPSKFAYCKPDGKGRTENGGNISPKISWQGAPAGTKSFAIVMVDKDVPVTFESANKTGVQITEDFPRQNFYHWTVVDIPATTNSIEEGVASRGVIKGGKPFGKTEYGFVGKNDYEKVAPGPNGGYDGPCPPWNDMRLHHYSFIVYALDVDTLNPSQEVPFNGPQLENAIKGHVLAQGSVISTYSNNPQVLRTKK